MNRNRISVQRCFISILILIFAHIFFVSMISASDFDFYEMDLISKESYRRISMDFRDADLKNILKIFSEQSGLNFVAAQSVADKTVTLYLEDVPLQEALKKIMAANNLKYELEPGGNIFVVKELGRPDIDVITKIYNLKFARLKGSPLDKAIKTGVGTGQEDSSTNEQESGSIEDAVRGILTSHGRLISDTRTNSLIVTDIASQFEVVDKLVALLDVSTPQVMIEVEMLDVSKRVIDEVGVDTTAAILSFTGAARGTRWPFSTDSPTMHASTAVAGPPVFTYGTLSNAVFTALLELLITDTKTKFLARPRILTLSNETAEIKIITNEAIGQNTVTSSSEGASTTAVQAERFETGVSLKVTPQVDSRTGSVTMFIQPTVAEAKTGATFEGTTYKDPEVRTSTTTLMVKDGETIVVGGLIRNKEETTIKKVPLLGDIPLLGALFRHKDKTDEERELIVFITPHILNRENVVAMARADTNFFTDMPSREQSSAVLRNEEVDTMLKRWEN